MERYKGLIPRHRRQQRYPLTDRHHQSEYKQPPRHPVADQLEKVVSPPNPSKHGWYRVVLAMVFGGAVWLQCIGAWTDSQTTDEAAHLAAGYSYWRTGDFRLNPEHPPLIKLAASLPLLALRSLELDLGSEAWRNHDQWALGAQLVYSSYESINGARVVMFLARLPMIAIWALLGWLIWRWSYNRWGRLGGLLSLTAFAYDPNWLGHGHLVTTDVGLALGLFGTVWALGQVLKRPSWGRIAIVSLIFALTQTTKFSALLLWLIIPLIGLIRLIQPEGSGWNWRWWWRLMAGLVIITLGLTWAVYGFEIKPIDADPRIESLWSDRAWLATSNELDKQPPFIRWMVAISDPAKTSGQWLADFSNQSIPAYSYWRGFFSTLTHSMVGHSAFLFGEYSFRGWWWYFPAAIVLKTPLVILGALLLAGLIAAIRWRPQRTFGFNTWLIGLPPLIYLLWSLSSHINIGIRHIFPIFPFMFLALGSLAAPWPRLDRCRIWVVTAVMLGTVSTALLSWPSTIGYFNALAGGTFNGHRYLLDSNLDWNQDIWRLRDFLDRQRFPEVHLVLFGSIPVHQIFPETLPVLTSQSVAAGQRPSGIIVISAGQLYNPEGPFSWLQSYQPDWRIGPSIWVFDFR